MRRIIVIGLLLVCLVTLCGCEEEPQQVELPTIRVLTMGGSTGETLQRISAAVSEITVEKLGCYVVLEQVSMSDYDGLIVEKRFSGDFPDLFVSQDKRMLSQLVQEGWAAPLEEALLQHPDLVAEISDENFWKSVSLNGIPYAVPFNGNYEYYFGFFMREDICEELGIDTAQIKTLEQLHDALSLVQRHYPEMKIAVPNFTIMAPSVSWDQMGDNIGVIMYREETVPRVELLVETREFYDWCKTMYQWNREGLIMEDVAFNSDARQSIFSSGNAFGGFSRINRHTVLNQKLNTGYQFAYARLGERRMDLADSDQSFCLFAGSENPVLAMEFLELLYTDRELLELCIYGQEGVDHDISDRNEVIPPIDSTLSSKERYVITTWCWPNREKVRNPEGGEELQAFSEGGTATSPAIGFVFDDTAVRSKMNICQRIVDKYVPALMAGQLNPDETLPLLLQELKQAGIDEVIAEKQRQLDQWMLQYGV